MLKYVVTGTMNPFNKFTIISVWDTLEEAKADAVERMEIDFFGVGIDTPQQRLEPVIKQKLYIRKVNIEVERSMRLTESDVQALYNPTNLSRDL